MNSIYSCRTLVLLVALLEMALPVQGAESRLPASEWQYRSSLNVPAAGWVRVPVELRLYDLALPELADVRIMDPAGREVPYLVEKPALEQREVRTLENLQSTLDRGVMRVRVPVARASRVRGIEIDTPNPSFVKSVSAVAEWAGGGQRELFSKLVFFRQGEVSRLGCVITNLPVEATSLTLTIDDDGHGPLVIRKVMLFEEDRPLQESETYDAKILSVTEGARDTRISLDLGAARIPLSALQLQTSEPLFARKVQLLERYWDKDELRERALAAGSVHRLNLPGAGLSEQLELPCSIQTSSRELVLSVDRGDSPGLMIQGVRVVRPRVNLSFLARQPGAHEIWVGSAAAKAPQYDLEALASSLRSAVAQMVRAGELKIFEGYRPASVLPEMAYLGAELSDPSRWRYQRAVEVLQAGVNRLSLPLHVLSQAQARLGDVRLVRDGRQVLYLLEHGEESRPVPVKWTKQSRASGSQWGRWKVELPQPGLPVTRLRVTARTQVFQRNVQWTEPGAERPEDHQTRILHQGTWTRTADGTGRVYDLRLSSIPEGRVLEFEALDADNAPLELESIQVFVPVAELYFISERTGPMTLYYGNPQAAAPRYDLSLVAPQILKAAKIEARILGEDPIESVARGGTTAQMQWLFYGVLALVVAGLVFLITRLLPKAASPGTDTNQPGSPG